MNTTKHPSILARLRPLALSLGLLLTPLLGLSPTSVARAASGDCTTSGNQVTCTFEYTGAAQQWTVPDGITQATFDVSGAQGGGQFQVQGGPGGRATATIPLSPGETLEIYVGGAGSSLGAGGYNGGGQGGYTGIISGESFSGGGGGGASDVRRDGVRIIVAGGGGGVGKGHHPGLGGWGGGSSGTDGGQGGNSYITGAPGGDGGKAGSDIAAGAGGDGCGAGDSGSGGAGGRGGLPVPVCYHGGGGGGGGYYGGGGGGSGRGTSSCGNCPGAGGGGGGGSGYGPVGVVFQPGAQVGAGEIVIIYLLDETAPVITPAVVGTLGNNGWYISNVTVSWNMLDTESAISSQTGCDPTTLNTDTDGTTLTCSATSAGGAASQSATIKVDQTKPILSAAATTQPNAAGWYNSDVMVQFTCADALSGIPADACPASQTLAAEGAAVASTAQTVSDAAGNTSDPSNVVAVQLDKSAPTLNLTVSPNPVAVGSAATLSDGAADVLSGIATLHCDPLDTSTPGVKSVTCTATDNAGNTASATTDYMVTAVVLSQLQQVQTVRTSLATLLPSGDSKTDKALQKAIAKLDQALASDLWQADGNHLTLKGEKAFHRVRDAVKELVKSKNPPQVVTVSRTLAQTALDEALAAGGNAAKIAKAQKEMNKGDQDRNQGKAANAISHYEEAWEYAQQAVGNPVLAASDPAEPDAASAEEAHVHIEEAEAQSNTLFLPVVVK